MIMIIEGIIVSYNILIKLYVMINEFFLLYLLNFNLHVSNFINILATKNNNK